MTVIKWNGRDLPEGLLALPPGDYSFEELGDEQDGSGLGRDWRTLLLDGESDDASARVRTHARITAFDRWVGANNIPEHYEYGKGWWDYVELVRRFASKFEADEVEVIGHYTVRTPPPEESLPMPAVMLGRGSVNIALKYDFGALNRWPREWTVSVRRTAPYRGPILGLFDPSLDLRGASLEGLPPAFLLGPYRENQAEFTCEVDDEWDVATLLQLVFHET
jgi:hypothetical protein